MKTAAERLPFSLYRYTQVIQFYERMNTQTMNNKPKISIIIPVWNSRGRDGTLLKRCFDSCINQTLQDIEVIAVNDCSPNVNDKDLMQEYAAKYGDKFKCLYLTENLRQGGSRNKGIQAASGQYLMFCDNDDFYELTACESMYNAAVSTNADIVYCNFTRGGKTVVTSVKRELFYQKYTVAPWAQLVRRSLVKDNGLYLYETGYHEDLVTALWYVYAKTRVHVNKTLYHWKISSFSRSNNREIWNAQNYCKALTLYTKQTESIQNKKARETAAAFIFIRMLNSLVRNGIRYGIKTAAANIKYYLPCYRKLRPFFNEDVFKNKQYPLPKSFIRMFDKALSGKKIKPSWLIYTIFTYIKPNLVIEGVKDFVKSVKEHI
jgi:glycosyltransferase involved in cell wall biosynthesis